MGRKRNKENEENGPLNELNPEELNFCLMYVNDPEFQGNAKACYMTAFDAQNVNTATSAASRLKDKKEIIDAISFLARNRQLTPEIVESVHASLLFSSDPAIRMRAVAEFYRITGRIVKQVETKEVDAFTTMSDDELDDEIKNMEAKNAPKP